MSSSSSKFQNLGVASGNDIDLGKTADIEDPKGGDGKHHRRKLPRFSIKLRIFLSLARKLIFFAVVPSRVICPLSSNI